LTNWNYLKFVIRKYRNETNIGQVIPFEETALLDETNIVSLGPGALGGKGRGLAFINTLIYNLNFSEIIPSVHIRTPITLVIGTDEFDLFMESNRLNEFVHICEGYHKIRKVFLESELSPELDKKLRVLMKRMKNPIDVRSSSLLEDSATQPFSGIFTTYLLPNNHSDFNVRLKQASEAIKLVYASIYSDNARCYFEANNFRIDDEKMAIVIQEVVGNPYNGCFYPQVSFYAVNMEEKELDLLELGQDAGLLRLEIDHAEKHGTLRHCASVYNADNDRIVTGLGSYGPRVVNFADILQYEDAPLAQTLELILNAVKEALGAPVEIEYAVDLEKDEQGRTSFCLLQIKPLVGATEDFEINLDGIDKDNALLYAEKSMGNGKVENIRDIIYVKPEKFEKTRTGDIIPEIEVINSEMRSRKKKYVLIGPGRWGARDRFIGIPVSWPQISNAKVIVEMSLPEFPLDASLGSHFFHNVTSMSVGYLSVQHDSPSDLYIKHVEFDESVTIVMDGMKRTSLITWNNHASI